MDLISKYFAHSQQLLHTQDTSTIWIVFRVCRVCLQLISHFTYFAFHFCIAFQCSSLPCAAESFQILVRWTNPHTSGNGTGSSRASHGAACASQQLRCVQTVQTVRNAGRKSLNNCRPCTWIISPWLFSPLPKPRQAENRLCKGFPFLLISSRQNAHCFCCHQLLSHATFHIAWQQERVTTSLIKLRAQHQERVWSYSRKFSWEGNITSVLEVIWASYGRRIKSVLTVTRESYKRSIMSVLSGIWDCSEGKIQRVVRSSMRKSRAEHQDHVGCYLRKLRT